MNKFNCSSCGWEINNPKWWLIAKDYSGKNLCDDCEMTLILKNKLEVDNA